MENKNILEEKISKFNPNENGLRDHGIFGLPFEEKESKIVLLPIPWEATVSYGAGTSFAPGAILEASQQIDLYDAFKEDFWKKGIALATNLIDIFSLSKKICKKTKKYLKKYSTGEINKSLQEKINNEYEKLNNYIEQKTTELLNEDKFVGVIGGEHGVILGYVKALAKKHSSFGILQIDAHSDLRTSYEGIRYSHASIFQNILEIQNIKKLVQIGIRDSSVEENNFIKKTGDRVKVFYDADIKKEIFNGGSWSMECDKIIKELPEKVYISFDIDGLDPALCPNTGTPVPGGFSYNEMTFLFEKIIDSGREVIGFDLCEVVPGKNDWDANVASRILYKLCSLIK
ncbi:MAG: agmatinase [Candidatus Paceibacterota bacterium]